jgi:hypothetical protein
LVIRSSRASYFRLVPGDVNGFLGLVVDNLSVLGLLAAVLIGVYAVPADIVFGRMFPGTALGVLAGDLVYTGLAVRLARRTGRSDVTAMPFGLDTPSTIGMALLVLGPAFAKFRAAGLDPTAAGLETWYLGMAATATMGVLKLFLSFTGRTVRRLVPMAGLLGSLAGIALTLIGFFPMVDLLQFPIVGFLTLGLILYALLAKGSVPLRMPGVLFGLPGAQHHRAGIHGGPSASCGRRGDQLFPVDSAFVNHSTDRSKIRGARETGPSPGGARIRPANFERHRCARQRIHHYGNRMGGFRG